MNTNFDSELLFKALDALVEAARLGQDAIAEGKLSLALNYAEAVKSAAYALKF